MHPATRPAGASLLALPSLLLLLPFLVVPLGMILRVSLQDSADPDIDWSLDNFARILQSGYYHAAFLRTLGIGAGVALLSAVLGLPLTYIIVRHPRWRAPVLAVVAGPLFINVVTRLYGWQLLLADSGPVNRALAAILPWATPVQFTGTITGMTIVMLHVMLPYMVFATFTSMQRVDPAVWEAAGTLGAGATTVFLRIALPLALPGIIAGAIIVFTLGASSYVVPAVMGGGRVNTFPTLIYQEAMALNFSMASAIAICLAVVLLPLSRLSALQRQEDR
jgi:putative spermidine/putrescine transport system permease protein